MTMKKNIFIRVFILACFYHCAQLRSDPVITFFFKPYPTFDLEKVAQKTAQKVANGRTLAKTRVKQLAGDPRLVSGVFVTYAGFLAASDPNGQVILPRKHDKPYLLLLVTNKITPIVRSGNTLAHWELLPEVPAKLYRAQKKDDFTTKITYWDVQEIPLPANGIIPLEALTILAKPDSIYIPTGITISQESPHLILPDMYVKKGIDLTGNALYMLNLTHYFGPILFLYKKGKEEYLEHITH